MLGGEVKARVVVWWCGGGVEVGGVDGQQLNGSGGRVREGVQVQEAG